MDRDEPPATPQRRPPEKQKTTTNSLLSLLTRRSTKVEPSPPSVLESNQQQPHSSLTHVQSASSTSAHSSPIATLNQFRQGHLRRHSSTQNLSSIRRDDSISVQHNNRGITKKAKSSSSTNRFSHQFTLCCSVHDDRMCTPPVSVRYNSLAQVELGRTQKNSTNIDRSSPTNNGQNVIAKLPNGGASISNGHGPTMATSSNSITLATVHSVQEPPQIAASTTIKSTDNHLLVAQSLTTDDSSNDDSADKTVVFNEYQSSIAMSACRSRLRERLLPPAGQIVRSLDLPNNSPSITTDQHFSSPDICTATTTSSGPSPARDKPTALAALVTNRNRSLSYDVLTGVRRPVSADSLAKQSLIAAQLLNLIPAERARERSYMAGRLAVNSLFGPSELDKVLPTREVKIYICTWNMNGQNPPKLMTDFVLPHSIDFVPDIVVVGTQESCSVRFEWEVSLQETLGPSHILLHSATLGTLHLCVFIRRDLIWFCSEPEDASLSVRPGTAFRTKGAVAISFCLFGTSMLFVTSHLTAHQQKVKERVQDVKRIIHSLDLPRNLNIRNKNKDVTQNFDNVFWCGDLNFRLGEPREKVLEWIENTKFPLPSHLPNGYLHTDQLKSVLSNGAAFKDFKEANITFPPTYKYDPGTQHFDTSSKQRAPAYTDRILFKYKSLPIGIRRGSNLANLLHTNQLECLAYDSVPSIVTSDHKPVWALFRSPVRPGLDSVPLAAGLFNREVYLEGMKRRLNNTEAGSSAVCTIQ